MVFAIEFITCIMYALHKKQHSNLGNCYYIILYYIIYHNIHKQIFDLSIKLTISKTM